jgi:hypothetical protein
MPKLCIAVVQSLHGFAYFISPLLLTRTTYRSSSFRFCFGYFRFAGWRLSRNDRWPRFNRLWVVVVSSGYDFAPINYDGSQFIPFARRLRAISDARRRNSFCRLLDIDWTSVLSIYGYYRLFRLGFISDLMYIYVMNTYNMGWWFMKFIYKKINFLHRLKAMCNVYANCFLWTRPVWTVKLYQRRYATFLHQATNKLK